MEARAVGRLVGSVASRPKRAYLVISVAAALPRLVVLVAERGTVLQPFTYGEKSDDIARTFLASGTFGFIPGHPTAYTQPLYSFFLIPLYWAIDRSWEVVGGSQIIVAAATALIVFEIGRRHLSAAAGLLAALIVALHPYSLWHDIHVNREILDGLLAAAIFLLALELFESPRARLAVGLGVVFGLSILGNVRLTALPLLVAALCLVYWKPSRHGLVLVGAMIAACVVTLAPWVIRNRVQLGCFALTTDSRGLWKANNSATLGYLQKGSWIDNIPVPKSFPPSAQDAGRAYRRHDRIIDVDECAQTTFFEHKVISFWVHHPSEKASLAVQASRMLWDPVVSPPPTRSDRVGWLSSLRNSVEPIYIGIVFALALVGFFVVPRRFAVLCILMLAYQWVCAIVFLGATRYRVPWDFVAALLAGAALVELAQRFDRRARNREAAAT